MARHGHDGHTSDESILEIPMSPMDPMGIEIAKLVSWEWE